MRSHRYRTQDLEIHALVRDGRPPAVVLLHGAAGNALGWAALARVLDGRRLVLVDLPGHGESAPVADWSLERLARGLAEAIGREHEEALVWGGHSWGGKTAAILASLVPDRARGLLLIDPSPATPVPIEPRDFVTAALAPELGPWASISEALADARSLPQYAAWTDDLRAAFERGLETRADGTIAARARLEWLIEIAAAALGRDDSETIGRVRCPTLLVVAERSLDWQQSTNVAVLGGLANVETAILPGRHWIHWDAPAPLGALVGRWLDEVAG